MEKFSLLCFGDDEIKIEKIIWSNDVDNSIEAMLLKNIWIKSIFCNGILYEIAKYPNLKKFEIRI